LSDELLKSGAPIMPTLDDMLAKTNEQIDAINAGNPTLAKELKDQAAQDIVTSAINSLADTDPAGAKELLDSPLGQDVYNGEQTARAEELIDKKRIEVNSKALTGALTAKYDIKDDYAAMLEETKSIEDTDEREATQQRLARLKSKEEDIRRDRQTEVTNDYHTRIFSDQLPPTDIEVDNDQRLDAGAKQTVNAWSKRQLSGEAVTTNRAVYADLSDMLTTETGVEAFKRIDFTASSVSQNLNNADYKGFLKIQRDLKSGKKNNSAESISTAMTRAKVYFQEAGIKQGVKAEEEDIAKTKVIQGELAKWASGLTEKPTELEIDQKLNSLFREYSYSKDPDARFFTEDVEKTFAFIGIDDIPYADIPLIEAALTKGGIEVTDENIVALFKRKLQKEKGQ
jgi:hypothetical protein